MAKETYKHSEIEKTAQEKWEALGLYRTDLADESKEPYYILNEFPYPSGDLHTGHWYAFAVTDIFVRLKRMQGKNVLFPIGFDAFGLPAENAAIKRGVNPAEWTYGNIDRMRRQLRTMGASFDWSKEVITCSPEYYRWTQWLFAKFFEHGLAYRNEAAVKWCPVDQTVLANEQVIDGHCERCGSPVEEKRLTQWFMKITAYAERLLSDLEALPWREEIKDAQRAWIGRSEGARITFNLTAPNASVDVFTTRPDTIFGATYLVLAPEHELVSELIANGLITNSDAVQAYRDATARKTERERSENKEKTGVRLEGVDAFNPATTEAIPVYVADYVLASYGTGAVMAVPAHDERDFEFATKMGLPMRPVVEPLFTKTTGNDAVREEPFVMREAVACVVKHWSEDKYLILKWKNVDWAGFVTGGIDGDVPAEAGRREILEETGYRSARFVRELGQVINVQFYHLNKKENRHARFQGMYYELDNGERDPVSEAEQQICDVHWVDRADVESMLNVPDMKLIWRRAFGEAEAYPGDGLLANSGAFSGRANRDAMREIVESVGGTLETQYRLRDWGVSRQRYWGCPIPVVYDPEGQAHLVPPEHLPWTLPTDVDFTPSGNASPLASSQELRDRVVRIFGEGWTPEYDTLDTFVDSSWYYTRYLATVDAERFSDPALMERWLPVDKYSGGAEHTTMHLLYSRFFYKALSDLALVPGAEPYHERVNRGIILGPDNQKMSKSKGNVVNPDEYVEKHGSDAVRMYLAFIGPYNEPGHYPWKPEGVFSMRKFLDRCYRLSGKVQDGEGSEAVKRALARATVKIADDLERLKTNTAVSALMILVNALEESATVSRDEYRDFLILLAPFAPHLAEHMYAESGGRGSVHQLSWPEPDQALLATETVTIGVQIAGKKRAEITISPEATEDEALSAALAQPKVAEALHEGKPSRVIYLPGRILNLLP